MKNGYTRCISFLLAMVMVLNLVPITASHVHGEEAVTGANLVPLYRGITVQPGQLMGDTEVIVENEIFGYVDKAFLENHPLEESLAGITISILGDSISTYTNVSNGDGAESSNSTISGNGAVYPSNGVQLADTWWQQAADTLGLEILVNNSWAGSCVHADRAGAGAYKTRAVQLHDDTGDNAGQEPDIIAVYLGTNDFTYYADTQGTEGDINYDVLIISGEDGFTYATPATVMEAYAITLHKIITRYESAEVYCFTLLHRQPSAKGYDPERLEQFNSDVRALAEYFGVYLVDLYTDCGITEENANSDGYIGDDYVHPNAKGMDAIAGCFISSVLKNSQYVSGEVYDVTYDLSNVFAEQGTARSVPEGTVYTLNLTVPSNWELSVTVTMGGIDVTDAVYADGVISIPSVSGDISITAEGKEPPQKNAESYRWEITENVLISTGNAENTPTLLSGSVAEGTLRSAYYQLAESVVLYHDRPWVVEWKGMGNWSGMLLAENTTSEDYLFKSYTETGLLALGSNFKHYGIALVEQDIDLTQPHVFRLENRIAEDGSNMVYLLVDGETIGAMNNYYQAGSSNQNQTVDWVNGRNLTFSYLGTSTHPLKDLKLEYLQIWEGGENSTPLSLRYDDHYDVTGKVVEILDPGTPTSYKVGYGVAEGTLDEAVVTLEGDTLVATGIGTAKVCIDGILCEVTVTAAPISLLLLIGQSNMRGSEGNADQSIICPEGMVYATFGDDRGAEASIMNAQNATQFAASALTGEYSTINVEGSTDHLNAYPINSLTEAGAGKIGPDSGFAYEWIRQTGEKVWIVNAAHGGSSIKAWLDGTTQFEECELLFKACQETLRKEIAAGHFTLSHMGYFWFQGCSDATQTSQWYVEKYLSMHESLKTVLAFDADSDATTEDITFEFAGIIPVRAGRDTFISYRQGDYTDTTTAKYFESFLDLRFTGPRVAQYWMTNNPELPDIWNVCNIGESWVTMPDGTDGVAEYFQTHYENGTVDYTTQVQQSDSWYTPTTPAAVHDSIHYNQIGYNEIGRESVRNVLVILGEIQAPDVETTVEFLSWNGYTIVDTVTAATRGSSDTLVVPKVYPLWKSKEVTYNLSDGLSWNDYDLLAESDQINGTLSAEGATGSVTVEGHNWSDWKTITEPSAEGAGEKQRICADCGKVEIQTVEGVWQIYDLGDHLIDLPEYVCCNTNLWSVLPHENVHFTSGKKWGTNQTPVSSITIPLNPGDRIYATSFLAAGDNGGPHNGIRLTFFDAYGIAWTLDPSVCYREWVNNGGYVEAPEGTIAVNIPLWGDSEDYEVYILSREHYNEQVTVEPTCTEQGYTGTICLACGAGTRENIVDATGHNYESTIMDPTCTEQGYTTHTCTACGDTYVDSYVDALAHTPGEVVVENQGAHGSCDLVIYCSVCSEELSREHDDGYLPGDINGDGKVNNKDVTRLFRYLSGYDVEVVEGALDVNGDGEVNNKDLTRLFRYLSGYDVEIN